MKEEAVIKTKILIFVPTYNERENVSDLFHAIKKNSQDSDVLFLDDNSPDGTGKIIDNIVNNNKNVFVIHRKSKFGIGSAHMEGFKFANKNSYDYLLTMDADFTHDPKYIPDIINKKNRCDIVIGSRYANAKCIKNWPLIRQCITYTAHFFTEKVLGMPYDCTGAYRLYNKKMINKMCKDFGIKSDGYSFFIESIYTYKESGAKISEVPIFAIDRQKGETKISRKEILNAIKLLGKLSIKHIFKK
ncbi:polyprenol monophosphomannose synthase [bacterium]|nr:polyprenol monophosphomannose synthase [bacterium]